MTPSLITHLATKIETNYDRADMRQRKARRFAALKRAQRAERAGV